MIDTFVEQLTERRLVDLDDHDAWLAARRTGIGGSDAAAVLGWSPWTSPWALWLDKAGGIADDQTNEAMEWGTRLEQVVADVYAERTGLQVIDVPGVFHHPHHRWMLASPDRFVVDPDRDGVGYLEIKTTSAWKADEWADGQVPIGYLAQWQHVAEVTGCRWGAFAALIGGNRLVVRDMEHDAEFVQMLTAAEEAFWNDHVLANVPPPIDGQQSTKDLLTHLYAESDPERQVELDDELAQALTDLHQAHELAREADEAKTAAANRIRQAMGNAETAMYGGVPVATWKSTVKREVSVSRLRAEFPEVADKVTEEKPVRTFVPRTANDARAALGLTEGG